MDTLFYCVADTTDVQTITAVVAEDYDSTLKITILCDFITGSNAQGCMVVLVGDLIHSTMNLTRNSTWTMETLTKCANLHDVFGFDIESDGSIGILPVPGVVIQNTTQNKSTCLPNEVTPSRKFL